MTFLLQNQGSKVSRYLIFWMEIKTMSLLLIRILMEPAICQSTNIGTYHPMGSNTKLIIWISASLYQLFVFVTFLMHIVSLLEHFRHTSIMD